MDEVVTSSLRVLRDNGLEDPRRFFESVDAVLTEVREAGAELTVDEFTSRFAERAAQDGFARQGEEFTRHLQDGTGQEVLRKLDEANPDEVVAEFEAVAAEPAAGPAEAAETADDGSYDEEVWTQFIAEFGTGWNGDDETWGQFCEWFLYYAAERGVTAPATSFLDYAGGESDKIAFFARYGIEIAGGAGEADAASEDPEQWQAFLVEFGPAWNGAEDTWAAFVPYFQHYAGERGVTGSAEAFLANAPEDNAERVAYFATYGITMTAPDGATAEPVAVEQAQAQFEQTVAAAAEVPPELAATVGGAFADLVREMPEAAELTPEEMQELLASEELQQALRSISAESAEPAAQS